MPILAIKRENTDTHYTCDTCNTPISNIYSLKKLTYYSYTYGSCFSFDNIINVVEIDGTMLHMSNNIIESGIGDMEYKNVHCIVCNNLLGWKMRDDKYILIKKRLS